MFVRKSISNNADRITNREVIVDALTRPEIYRVPNNIAEVSILNDLVLMYARGDLNSYAVSHLSRKSCHDCSRLDQADLRLKVQESWAVLAKWYPESGTAVMVSDAPAARAG